MKFMLLMVLFTPLAFGAEDPASGKSKRENPEETEKLVMAEVEKRLKRVHGENIGKLFKDFLKKENELKEKEANLKEREEQLKINTSDLIKKIKKFEEEQQEIIGCVKKNEESENERVNQIVNVISNMRPAKAAEILSVQELPISVKILGLLEPGKASKIFNLMDKEISARIQKMYLSMKK